MGGSGSNGRGIVRWMDLTVGDLPQAAVALMVDDIIRKHGIG